jgi:hypothetical protein
LLFYLTIYIKEYKYNFRAMQLSANPLYVVYE